MDNINTWNLHSKMFSLLLKSSSTKTFSIIALPYSIKRFLCAIIHRILVWKEQTKQIKYKARKKKNNRHLASYMQKKIHWTNNQIVVALMMIILWANGDKWCNFSIMLGNFIAPWLRKILCRLNIPVIIYSPTLCISQLPCHSMFCRFTDRAQPRVSSEKFIL